MKRIQVILAVLSALAIAACGDDSKRRPSDVDGGTDGGPEDGGDVPEPVETGLVALVGPGEHAAIQVDLAAATSDSVDSTPSLTAAAEEAVARAPSWVRSPLRIRLAMLGVARQDELAALVIEAPDDRLVDEIAFSIANVQEDDLQSNWLDPGAIVKNAQAVYDFADLVPFAEVVDTGGPGDDDYSSTVRYLLTDEKGAERTWELPTDSYYWWVVHPKLDFEDLVPLDPATSRAAAPPQGVHWRRYVMESSEETFDYRDHFVMRRPNDLRDVDLDLAASAHLTEPDIYPLRVFVDEAGNGLLVEVDLGSGTLLASTLDVAGAAAGGSPDLLENLSTYGNGNVLLRARDSVALVIDAEPWGSDLYGAALAGQGIAADRYRSDELAGVDLSAYDKVIVAADQDAAFYATVASLAAALEDFVRDWGVLQLDLHTDADLSGLAMPGGFEVEGEPPEAISVEGQPRLVDYISLVPYLWDGVAETLGGSRAPDVDSTAMDVVGWVVTQNMFDNVSEYVEVTGNRFPERTQFPQRILYNHFGNCGELGDLMGATGRASLMAVRVVESVEDHCWNEVLVEGRWVPWQVDWSDGPTRIDDPLVGSDEELGGGKTLSGVWSIRGDGYPQYTPGAYTGTVTVRITVRDPAGRPVDGAMVLVLTEAFYDHDQLTVAGMGYTGPDGVAELILGNDRNYWYFVSSPSFDEAGRVEFPDDGNLSRIGVEQLATAEEAVTDATLEANVVLDPSVVVPAAGAVEPGGDALATATGRIETSFTVSSSEFYPGSYIYTDGSFIHEDDGATLRYYLLDDEAYRAFAAGGSFTALAAAEDALDIDVEDVAVPAEGPVWLVAANASVTQVVEVDLRLVVSSANE